MRATAPIYGYGLDERYDEAMQHGGYNAEFRRRVNAKRRAEQERQWAEQERQRLLRYEAEIRSERRRAVLGKVEDARDLWLVEQKHPQDLRTIRAIMMEVCSRHGITMAEMLGSRRSKPLVNARIAAVRAVADAKPHISLVAIGRAFHRDHTSILHLLKKTKREGQAR